MLIGFFRSFLAGLELNLQWHPLSQKTFLKGISNNLQLISFQKMYGLWGYLSKAKALTLINARRVFEGGWYLKVPIVFMTWCYRTPYSEKERVHSLWSWSVSTVKESIVFPSFHIFARLDGQRRTRILYLLMRFKKRGESLVRCGGG